MIILFLFWKHVGELSTVPSTTVKHLQQYIAEHGEDMPQISGWAWGQHGAAAGRSSSTESDNA